MISESNDAARLIKNYKNRNDGKHSSEEQDRMKQMELRLSVRKGAALSKQGKVSEAIKEYERALQLEPKNVNVLKSLKELQSGI